MKNPDELHKYLTQGEELQREFKLATSSGLFDRDTVHASNKRPFIMRGNTITDVSYNHVSSIEYGSSYPWLAILLGLLIAIYSALSLSDILPSSIPSVEGNGVWLLLAVGLLFTLLGILFKREYITLAVVGRTRPIILSANRATLDDLFLLVRQKQS